MPMPASVLSAIDILLTQDNHYCGWQAFEPGISERKNARTDNFRLNTPNGEIIAPVSWLFTNRSESNERCTPRMWMDWLNRIIIVHFLWSKCVISN